MPPKKKCEVIFLHEHRDLNGHPERELRKLLWRLLKEKYQDDILEMAEDYAEEKARQTLAQLTVNLYLDREELYESLIAWVLLELGELTPSGKRAEKTA